MSSLWEIEGDWILSLWLQAQLELHLAAAQGNGWPGPSSGLEIVKQVLHAMGLARQPGETENVCSSERCGLCVGGGERGASPCISVLLGVREERSALGMELCSGAHSCLFLLQCRLHGGIWESRTL